ncbi:hypothetical protein RA266_27820, partial [Pseudomonas syringae pv. tagetis]|uniref:hypothetical protein n=1 Tax=Pseudomonas syringae group genomosp. 7 TaxID=251699 RepID=UPI0037703721
LFVDYAGQTAPIIDRQNGGIRQGAVLVGLLGGCWGLCVVLGFVGVVVVVGGLVLGCVGVGVLFGVWFCVCCFVGCGGGWCVGLGCGGCGWCVGAGFVRCVAGS